MRLKNIYLLFIIGLTLTACVDDTLLNEEFQSTRETSAQITFTLDGMFTKAQSTEAPTTNESKINNCLVAFFTLENGAPTTCIDMIEQNFQGTPNTTVAGKDAYQFERNVTLKKGDNVHVLVIANSKQAYSKTDDYATFKTKVEKNTNAAFTDAELVKVGELVYTVASTGANNIIVPLTQLTARIDFKGFTVNGSVKTELRRGTKTEYSEIKLFWIESKQQWWVVRTETITDSVVYSYKGFVLQDAVVKNIAIHSDVIIPAEGNSRNVTANLPIPAANIANNQFSFYTYEKPYVDETNEATVSPIQIVLHGKYGTITEIAKSITINTVRGAVRNPGGNIPPGQQSKDEPKPESNKNWSYTIIDEREYVSTSNTSSYGIDFNAVTMDFAQIINPNTSMVDSYTNGVTHGNIYSVNGTIPVVPN